MFAQWKEEFDPELLSMLGAAFDLAWGYLEKSDLAFDRDETKRMLASALLGLAEDGERNRLRLANRSIGMVLKAKQRPLSNRATGLTESSGKRIPVGVLRACCGDLPALTRRAGWRIWA